MSDPAAAEAQAPQAEVTPTSEGAQPPTSGHEAPASPGITDTPPAAEASEPQTLEEVMAVLNQNGNHQIPLDPDAPAAAAESEERPEEEQQETEQPPAEEQPPKAEAPVEEEDSEEGVPKRIRIGHLPPANRAKMAAVFELLREKPELTFEQALSELRITTPETPAAREEKEPSAEKAPEPAQPAKSSETITAEIAELNKQRRAALKAFDNEKAVEIEEAVEAAEAELTQARTREAQARDAETQREQSHQTAVNASVKEAATLYPDVLKEGTPLYQAVQEETKRLAANNSALLQDPDWPIALAAKHAARLRIAPAAAPAKTPPPAPKPVVRPRPAPAPGVTPASPRTSSPAAAPKAADREQELADAMAYLNANGNRQVAAA